MDTKKKTAAPKIKESGPIDRESVSFSECIDLCSDVEVANQRAVFVIEHYVALSDQ